MTVHDPLSTQAQRAKIRAPDFFALSARGAFLECAKAELLDGEIWTMNAQHRPHAMAKMDLYDALRDALNALGLPLRPVTEATVDMGEHDAPEPDITLTSDPYGEGSIPVASVALLIEIADSTVSHDLTIKSAIYARHAVPEYWVIDLPGRTIHQFWAPAVDSYSISARAPLGSRVSAQTISGLHIWLKSPAI